MIDYRTPSVELALAGVKKKTPIETNA